MVVRGEEEATIVIDVGSSSAKAGFSGEDIPRAVCPSVAEDLNLSAEELSTYRARRPEVRALGNRGHASRRPSKSFCGFANCYYRVVGCSSTAQRCEQDYRVDERFSAYLNYLLLLICTSRTGILLQVVSAEDFLIFPVT